MWDVILVGNMICGQNETKLLVTWLEDLNHRGKVVLLGDPHRALVSNFKDVKIVAEYKLPKETTLHQFYTQTKVFRLNPYNVIIPKETKEVFENKWLTKYENWREIIKNQTNITNENNLTPEIKLHLIASSVLLQEDTGSTFKETAYFGFYWAGGQGLSRYILDNSSVVKGKRVLDLGSGCGATAIAAAKAGARSVTANDIDPVACVSVALNAQLNNVSLEIFEGNLILQPSDRWDVIVAGNFMCKKNETLLFVKWLNDLSSQGKVVLIGSPGRVFVKCFKKVVKVAEYKLPEHTYEHHAYFTRTSVFRVTK